MGADGWFCAMEVMVIVDEWSASCACSFLVVVFVMARLLIDEARTFDELVVEEIIRVDTATDAMCAFRRCSE